MTLPNNVSTGTITGKFLVAVADGADGDYDPDGYPAQGTITFTPAVSVMPDPTADEPAVILAPPITGVLDAGGYLCTPDPSNPSKAGRRGLKLIATDDPDVSATAWTWRVEYKLDPINKVPVPQIPAHPILVPSGGTVDLADFVPVPSSPGVGIDQVTIIAGQAFASAANASASAATAATQATNAATSATAAAGSATAAQTTATNLEANANNPTSAWWAVFVAYLKTLFVRKGDLVLNIKDYGATGVATQDITVQVQSALADLNAAGGGKLLFKDGEFWWPSPHTAQIKSNTTIEGINATLVKRLSTDSTALFCIKSDGATGYGSGARNVRFVGLRIRGDFTTGRTAGLLGANHGSNITVENCVFDECLGRGHIMDLGGCENVTIRNNVFRGASYPLDSDKYNECIQADNSTYDGSSAPETVPGSYDGLPSRNFIVQGNKFLPITVAGVNYPAPTPFGSHFSVADQYHTNLQFLDNVVDTPADDSTSLLRGIVHFRGAKGIRVKGNRFINRGNVACHAVKTHVITSSFTTADAGTQNAVSTTLATPMVCSDIEVSGNTFVGFGNTAISTIAVVSISGDQTSGTNVAGVKVSDNRFEACYGADYTANVGANLVETLDCVDVEVERNSMDGGRRLLYFQDVDRIGIRNNKISKSSSGVAVQGLRGTCVDFTGNKLNDYAGGFLVSAGSGVLVSNNQFRGERAGSFTSINIGGTSTRFIVTGNDILSSVTTSKGVLIQQTSTVGIVRSNTVTGQTTPISVTADSTATVDGNL